MGADLTPARLREIAAKDKELLHRAAVEAQLLDHKNTPTEALLAAEYDWKAHRIAMFPELLTRLEAQQAVVEAARADRDHGAECFGCETCDSLQDDLLAALATLEALDEEEA